VAQRLKLVDEVAGLAALVDAAGVVVGAEVLEAGGGIGEQVPDDHQDRAGHSDQSFTLADAPDQAAVALAKEGVGLGGGGGGLPEARS
jgi:paraquat-inducible protein B